MTPTVIEAAGLNDRNLIEAIVGNFFIIDYGFITKVNPDKTVNVTHAKRPKSVTGEDLREITTTNLEVLTIAGKGFSLNFDFQKGDKVLLLGLKNYIKKTGDVNNATNTDTYLHYSRETMKVLPLCVFNDDAKVKVEIAEGTMTVTTAEKIELNGNQIELNGNDKQFVTWAELNQALMTFTQSLTTAMTTTPIAGNGAPQPTWSGMDPTGWSINIDQAKTTTVVTGG